MSHWQKPPLGARLIPGHPMANGLVGCWLMNEGSGNRISDLSGNGNNGVLTNGPLWVPGKSGPALSFDGVDDYVEVPDDNTLDLATTDFTLMAWVKRAGVERDTIIDKAEGTLNGYQLFIYETDNKPRFRIDSGTGAVGSANTAITDTNWHHVMVTVDRSGNAIFYLDGDSDGTLDVSTQSGDISSTTPLGIGANTDPTPSNFLTGQIDEVRIYNRALSAQEVAQLYQSPYAMFEPEPIWLFQSAAVGGQSPVPIIMQNMNQFNGGMAC